MIKEMKKTIVRNALILVFALMILGIILIAVMFDGAMPMFGPKKNIYDASVKEINNTDYAKIEIDKYNLYGCFAEEYERRNGVKKTTAYYCILLVGDESDMGFMAVKVGAKYKDKLEKIEKEYTDLDNGIDSDDRTVIKLNGKLSKMNGQLYDDYKNFILKYDEIISLNLCLEEAQVNKEVVFFVIGVVLILVSIIILIFVLATGGVGKVKKQFKDMTPEELERLDSDYMSAACINKNLRIGRYYTFIMSTMNGAVRKNDEIVWAFMSKTTHRTNGVPTGTTYAVTVYDVNGKSYSIQAKNEQMCQEILQKYAQISDRIIIGYDDEYMRLMRTNFKQFLSIAYNRIDNVPDNQDGTDTGFDNFFR